MRVELKNFYYSLISLNEIIIRRLMVSGTNDMSVLISGLSKEVKVNHKFGGYKCFFMCLSMLHGKL